MLHLVLTGSEFFKNLSSCVGVCAHDANALGEGLFSPGRNTSAANGLADGAVYCGFLIKSQVRNTNCAD